MKLTGIQNRIAIVIVLTLLLFVFSLFIGDIIPVLNGHRTILIENTEPSGPVSINTHVPKRLYKVEVMLSGVKVYTVADWLFLSNGKDRQSFTSSILQLVLSLSVLTATFLMFINRITHAFISRWRNLLILLLIGFLISETATTLITSSWVSHSLNNTADYKYSNSDVSLRSMAIPVIAFCLLFIHKEHFDDC